MKHFETAGKSREAADAAGRTPLEAHLAEHLGRVEAPGNLWGSLRAARYRTAPATSRFQPALAFAAAAVVLALGGYFALELIQPSLSVEALAVESLRHEPSQLGILSTNATEIRDFLRQQGIDVPLPPEHSGMVTIIGASVIPGTLLREPVAEISYRVGEYNASLVVANDPSAIASYPTHEARASDLVKDARVSTWAMRGQNYALAWAAPGEFRVACLLCHGGTEPQFMN